MRVNYATGAYNVVSVFANHVTLAPLRTAPHYYICVLSHRGGGHLPAIIVGPSVDRGLTAYPPVAAGPRTTQPLGYTNSSHLLSSPANTPRVDHRELDHERSRCEGERVHKALNRRSAAEKHVAKKQRGVEPSPLRHTTL
ncbi:hypothetical protein J6590_043534 [Homalodisca vitripennis]|nr:hypothetical protein J6590_043534 [Homalodisca vitripennis]